MDNEQHHIIQSKNNETIPQCAPRIPNPINPSNIKFENDFGESPILLGYLTKDQSIIAILSLAGAFVGATIAGIPLFGILLLAGLNDIKYVGKDGDEANASTSSTTNANDHVSTTLNDPDSPKLEQETIEVTTQDVSESVNQNSPGGNTTLSATVGVTQPLNVNDLIELPPRERAIALLTHLSKDGFDVSRCIADQITCICGNQRGGKGTLMAILAILSCAIDADTKIHYFTAGDDIYPFRCDKLYCRLSYPNDDGSGADAKVAAELYRYLKAMDNATVGAYNDIILVIDEAVALSDYLEPDQKQWMIRFLLTRANKKGAQIFIVLHGINLTSWVGTGNAGGFSSTFKTGATFIGCESKSKKINPLRSISVATGRYFLANPDDFSKPVTNGDLGIVPDWLKSETNPSTGQPDPARTLLNFFPELRSDEVISAMSRLKIIEPKSPNEQQKWDRFVLESTDEEINHLIESRRNKETPEKTDSTKRHPLNEAEQKVIEFAWEKPNEWLPPSWFTNNKEYFKSWKSEQIIELFHRLKAKGYGDTIWSNGTRKFRLESPES